MLGLSIGHIMLMLVVVVLIFGTSKLQSLGKDLGGAIRGFKEAMNEGEETKLQPVLQHVTQQSQQRVVAEQKVKEPV